MKRGNRKTLCLEFAEEVMETIISTSKASKFGMMTIQKIVNSHFRSPVSFHHSRNRTLNQKSVGQSFRGQAVNSISRAPAINSQIWRAWQRTEQIWEYRTHLNRNVGIERAWGNRTIPQRLVYDTTPRMVLCRISTAVNKWVFHMLGCCLCLLSLQLRRFSRLIPQFALFRVKGLFTHSFFKNPNLNFSISWNPRHGRRTFPSCILQQD